MGGAEAIGVPAAYREVGGRRQALSRVATLAELNRLFDRCPRCQKQRNPLQHVFGDGRTEAPDYCFVLINPTHRNISSHPSYTGSRFPFIGVKAFWRVLNRGGFFSDRALAAVEGGPWNPSTTAVVLEELRNRSVYLTNLVKCSQNHPAVPSLHVLAEDLPLFRHEIFLVRPRTIVAFGRLTASVLTGQRLQLQECFKAAPLPAHAFDGIPVIPSYFPIGRGNPKLAAAALQALGDMR